EGRPRAAEARVRGPRVGGGSVSSKARASKRQRPRSVAAPASVIRALEWRGGIDGSLRLLQQTMLPEKVAFLDIEDVDETVRAIRRLDVRGAPAIGCAAAYGVVLGLRASKARTTRAFLRDLDRVREKLAASRPTAVNLFWALDRMARSARSLAFEAMGRDAILERLLGEARAIHAEDEELCRAIGEHGASLLGSGATVLTHCNAGALATGGLGT